LSGDLAAELRRRREEKKREADEDGSRVDSWMLADLLPGAQAGSSSASSSSSSSVAASRKRSASNGVAAAVAAEQGADVAAGDADADEYEVPAVKWSGNEAERGRVQSIVLDKTARVKTVVILLDNKGQCLARCTGSAWSCSAVTT
jgi:hypothetical protein